MQLCSIVLAAEIRDSRSTLASLCSEPAITPPAGAIPAPTRLSRYQDASAQAATAERGLFVSCFWRRLAAICATIHPMLPPRATHSASALAMSTTQWSRRDQSTTYSDPYTCAHFRVAAISGGRRPGRGLDLGVAAAATSPHASNHELRYEIAEEFINVGAACGIAGATRPSLPISRPANSLTKVRSSRSTTRVRTFP